jgi:hypothetical protein
MLAKTAKIAIFHRSIVFELPSLRSIVENSAMLAKTAKIAIFHRSIVFELPSLRSIVPSLEIAL